MTNRKQVTEYTSVLRGNWCTENIEDLIHELKHLRSQGELDEESIPYSSENVVVLNAIKSRKENDKEYAARIEKENQQKESRRLEYERLKKEFDNV